MKIKILRSHLLDILKSVMPAVSPRATLPVLSHVLISANEYVSMAATNLTIGIVRNAPGMIEESGQVCVPAKTFMDLISAQTGEYIELKVDNAGKLKISCGKFNADLNTLPAEEFPPQEPFNYEGQEVDGTTFAKGISKVVYAASTDEFKPVLQGIKIDGNGKQITLVATDGFRLAVTKVDGDAELHALVPATSLNTVSKFCGNGPLKIRQENGRLVFTGQGWMVITLLVDGNYPDYNVIVPRQFKATAKIKQAEIRAAVRAAQTLSTAMVDLNFKQDALEIISASDELGTSCSEVEYSLSGQPKESDFHLNPAFLADSINYLDEEYVELRVNGHRNPIIVIGPDQPDSYSVLMPLHKG